MHNNKEIESRFSPIKSKPKRALSKSYQNKKKNNYASHVVRIDNKTIRAIEDLDVIVMMYREDQ